MCTPPPPPPHLFFASIRCSYSLTWTLTTTWLQHCQEFLYFIHCKCPSILHFRYSFATSPSFSLFKNCAFILKYKLTFLFWAQYKMQTWTSLQQVLQTKCSSIWFYWFDPAQQFNDHTTEPLQHTHTYVTTNYVVFWATLSFLNDNNTLLKLVSPTAGKQTHYY
jgi:hypothetical protein